MNKLPHEYLRSSYKKDIKIIFEFRDGRYLVILRYREGKEIFECSERICSVECLEDLIRSAEVKLVDRIKAGVEIR